MAGAPSIPARVLEASVRINGKLGQAEEDDARALLKADFDEGIATIRSGDDRVDATCSPDP